MTIRRGSRSALAPLALAVTLAAASASPSLPSAPSEARRILESFTAAWRGREEMTLPEEMVLALRVTGQGGGEFHAILPVDGPGRLLEGAPERYAFGFETDLETLRRLDRGEWSALTAMGQASASDSIPLRPLVPEGFRWTLEDRATYLPLIFHFWHREWPEITRFGEGTTRLVHGANAAVLYYDQGLRTAWYQLRPGMHINADPGDQRNEFDTLLIVTRGALRARLAGIERMLCEGEAVLVPAGMTHEFWAEPGDYGEFVIVMFGKGA